MEKDKVLEKIYYDVDEGFGSVQDVYNKARKVDGGITLEYVRTWMRKQPNKQTRNYKQYNSYTGAFPRQEYQYDIMDVISLLRDVGIDEKESKKQPRYGLVCIDIFSKKGHVIPMSERDGNTVYDAFLESFKVMGQPLSIYSDADGSFKSKKLQEYFNGEGITHTITLTHANQAERFIRTVKKMLADRLRHNKKPWVEMLKPVLNKYNNTQVQGSVKMTPNQASNINNAMKVRSNLLLKEKHNRKYPRISEGDLVKVFDKGKGNYVSRKESRSQFTARKYKVILVGKDLMNNTYYKLEGLTKRYNRHELLLIPDD